MKKATLGQTTRKLTINSISVFFLEKGTGTLQGRLPAELAERGIVEMGEANRFLAESFIEDFNRRFMVASAEEREAFAPLFDARLDYILCFK